MKPYPRPSHTLFRYGWGKGHRAKSCTRCGGPALLWLRQLGVALRSSETMCLFPGTFSAALRLSLPLLPITSVLPPSKPGANILPVAEDSAPVLAHTRTKGQEQ